MRIAAGEAARREFQFRLRIAARKRQRLGDELCAVLQRLGDIGEMRQVAIGDLRLASRPPGDVAGLGDHGKGRLAVELHEAIGKHRLVIEMTWADVIGVRHVPGRQHPDDAGVSRDLGQVHRDDLGMGAVGHSERTMQQACQRLPA